MDLFSNKFDLKMTIFCSQSLVFFYFNRNKIKFSKKYQRYVQNLRMVFSTIFFLKNNNKYKIKELFIPYLSKLNCSINFYKNVYKICVKFNSIRKAFNCLFRLKISRKFWKEPNINWNNRKIFISTLSMSIVWSGLLVWPTI